MSNGSVICSCWARRSLLVGGCIAGWNIKTDGESVTNFAIFVNAIAVLFLGEFKILFRFWELDRNTLRNEITCRRCTQA